MIALFLACQSAATDPGEDTGGAPDTADSGGVDSGPRGESAGSCDVPAGDAVGFDTVYAGNASYVDDGDWVGGVVEAQTFADAAAWEGWTADFQFGDALGSVDFSNHRVAAGLVVVPSTCGLGVVTTTATQQAGSPIHVELGVEDSSGGCDTNCSMVGQVIVALSVPTRAEGEPTVCVRRLDVGC